MTQIERDTSVMTLFLFLFAFMFFFSFLFFLPHPFALQAQWGREPSSKQAKVPWAWLCRSPGIRKTSSMTPEEALSGTPHQARAAAKPRTATWGQHFTTKPPPQPGSSLRATLSAKAMSVYPSCPPGHLAACLSGCCQGG